MRTGPQRRGSGPAENRRARQKYVSTFAATAPLLLCKISGRAHRYRWRQLAKPGHFLISVTWATTEPAASEGAGECCETCFPYSSDYDPQDWQISLTELLRIIQFYNTGPDGDNLGGDAQSYYRIGEDEPATEDGFCPGDPPTP